MKPSLPDVQSWPDERRIYIDQAGVKGVKHPIVFIDKNAQGLKIEQATNATVDMTVGVMKELKGTHMSRFLEILHEAAPFTLSLESMPTLLDTTLTRLHASSAQLAFSFDYFVSKVAPASKITSFMDYQICLEAEMVDQSVKQFITLQIPVTTLCPCSKKISDYGAHNQRSLITAKIALNRIDISMIELIQCIEGQGSCEIYGIIKREDEKSVTESAYENPKFAEDVVRDVAIALEAQGLTQYRVSTENIESIHNHAAFAMIDKL